MTIGVRLSVMMFLQFFVWGAWYVTTGQFLGKQGWGIAGTVYALCPIAAMISPIFLGMVADRFFATQKVLACMHLLGGISMFWLASIAGSTDADPSMYTWVLLAHALCYMPTIGLANTLAFRNLTDQARQFPIIRVFGTLGWIAAGTLVSWGLGVDTEEATVEVAAQQYTVTAVASILLAVFCLSLPHTPPPAAGKKVSLAETIGLGALPLMKQPAFLVFMLCSFLTCIPLMAYYTKAQIFVGESGFEHPAFIMSFGQWVEVIFMLLMPVMFARLGVKWMLAAGMAAWVLRYALFSFGAGDSAENAIMWMVLVGILLHGICYDFFFVTGYIYVDKVAPEAIRGQAQGLLVFMTLGVGSFVGSYAVDELVSSHKAPEAVALEQQAAQISDSIAPLLAKTEAGETLSAEESSSLTAKTQAAKGLRTDAAKVRKNWADIWMVPAVGALAILLVFLAVFRYRPGDESVASTSS